MSARNAGEPGSWPYRSGPGPAWRIAGVGLAGAGLGAAVAGIWHGGVVLGNASCPSDPRASGDLGCLPLGLWLLAIIVNGTVIALGVLGAFTALRLGPRRVLVPFGCVVTAAAVIEVASGVSGPPVPLPWAAALEAGAGLAAVALATLRQWVRVAGPLAVAVVLTAGWVVPRVIADHQRADARLAGFTALTFPLEAPRVPGYHLYVADADEGVLSVTVRQDIPRPGTTEVTVVIGPAGGTWERQQLALCTTPFLGRQPLYACRTVRPGVLLMANATDGNAVMVTRAGLVAMASANAMPTPVATATLIAVASSLHPVSAATLAGLAG